MKKFKKLIPAFCMLLVSAILLGSSTYAWFSMNTTVTATGMQVTAKSDFTYFVISNKIGDVTGADYSIASATAVTASGDLKPVAHEPSMTAAEIEAAKGTSADDAKLYKNWFTANGMSNVDGAAASGSKKELSMKVGDTQTDNFPNYVLKNTFYVGLAAGSVTATNITATVTLSNLNATTTGDKVISPIRVIVVCGNVYKEFKFEKSSINDAAKTVTGVNVDADGDSIIIASLAAGVETAVSVYVYYDGSDSAVTTSNFTNLDGASVTVTFNVPGN